MAASKPAQAPLIKDIKALKELLLWCKTEGVQSIEVAGVKAEFSQAAMVGPETAPIVDTRTPEQRAIDEAKADDEIKFWSVK